MSRAPEKSSTALRIASGASAAVFFLFAALFYDEQGISLTVGASALFGIACLGTVFGSETHFQLLFGSTLFLLFAFSVVRGLVEGFVWFGGRFTEPVKIHMEQAPRFYWGLQCFLALVSILGFSMAVGAWRKLTKRNGNEF
jgi:hypothetical protein